MLDDMRKTISMSELAKNAERIAKDIDASGAIYHVKRPGTRGMLLMDAEYFEGWRAAIEMMQRPNWQEEWQQARRELARGEGRRLDEVARELGLDRPAQPRRRKPAAGAPRTGRAKSLRRTSRAGGRSE